MAAKLKSTMIGLVVAAMVLAPTAMAHLTATGGSATSGLFTNGDVCRHEGGATAGACKETHNGVSGSYVGGASLIVLSDLFPIGGPISDGNVTGQGEITFSGLCSADDNVEPGDGRKYCATWGGLCDAEWIFDDSAPLNAVNENKVDGAATGGAIPDGTWDDGGQGAVCHTDNAPVATWRTYGCDGWYAHAEDLVSGGNVWMAPQCDFLTPVNSETFDGCVINHVILGGPDLGALTARCLDLLPAPIGSGTPVSEDTECGADTASDVIVFARGHGSLGVGTAFPGTGTATLPTDPTQCNDATQGLASVVVLSSVEQGAASVGLGVGGVATVNPAIAGWVDSTRTNAAPWDYSK